MTFIKKIMTAFTKQPDKYINNWRMRYSIRFNAWVNIQGTYVYREYNDSSLNGPLRIYKGRTVPNT